MFLLLTIFFIITYASDAPVKCIIDSPYNIRRTDVVLSVDKALREAQAWYEYRLSYMIENINLLPNAAAQDAAVDHFMEVYCTDEFFKGFIGITGTGQLFTNRTQVKNLYKSFALTTGTDVTFNVNVYNHIITIPSEAQTDSQSIYANLTAFNRHATRFVNVFNNNTINFSLIYGYYINEWRIDQNGNMCLSRFHDVFLKVFNLDHTVALSQPWDLDI